MQHPMAEVPAASKADNDEDDLTPDPVSLPAQPAVNPAGKDGQGTGGRAEVLGPDRARIGNWPDPM
jgi:hypothetical protein